MENSKSFQRTQTYRNDSFYKIYVSSSPFKTNNAQSQFFNIDSNSSQCIRCGRDMKGFQSVFVTICLPNMQPMPEKGMLSNIPSFRKQSSFTGMGQRNIINTEDVSSSDGIPISSISINLRSTDGSCPLCQNNTSFISQPEINYVSRIRYHTEICTCNDSSDSGESSTINIASPSSPERYSISDKVGCKFHTPILSNIESNNEILSNLSSKDQFVSNESLHSTSRGIPNDRAGDIFPHRACRLENPIKANKPNKFEILADTSFTPCNDCHVAVVDATRPNDDDQRTVCLMFQVSNVTDITEAYLRKYECHLSSNIDVGIGVNPEVLVDNDFLKFNSAHCEFRAMSSKKTVECRNCGESVYSENIADHECYYFENGNKLSRNSVPPTVEKRVKTELKITKIGDESVNTASEEDKGISNIQNSIKRIMDMNKRRFPGNNFSFSTKGYYNNNKDTDLTEQSTTSNDITDLEISDQNLTPSQSNEKGLKDDDQYPPLSTQSASSDCVVEASKPQISKNKTLPLNAQLKDEPKQAWNANLKGKVSGKVNGPQPTKKYRHYPVSCEFCNKKFQPSALVKHIREEHPDDHIEPSKKGSYQGLNHEKPRKSGKKKEPKAKLPKQLKICYICGRMYGSQSLKIHEPKCLEKWRIENERLPEHKQMPEPIKPETHTGTDPGRSLPQTKGYDHNLPDLNAEAEAAYQCHLRNLVPCDFCGRTFNPDRVMVHEKACIERPEKKKGKIASE